MTSMSTLIELDSNAGCTLNNLSDMKGALMLLDNLIEDMEDNPEVAASYLAEGIISKKLSAIRVVFRSCLEDSQDEMVTAQRHIRQLTQAQEDNGREV
ncbi:hypothetical protein [Sediminibacillus terrae]|uniref:hypothetical protein n=1 Tax=Sediminibacillus terrae TaxID=1562106 RepID=UPI00129619D3|nr:hypothetical protein [Sediminibacillus terrae]